jgi:hypothetical protein
MEAQTPNHTDAPVPADVRRALKLATWTDARFIDPLLGFLLPGAGDAIGAVVGLYIVVVARRHGVPPAVLARMMFNLAVDCLAGVVPFVGDLIDLVNRANLRNARLLERHLSASQTASATTQENKRSRSLAVPVAVLVIAIAAAFAMATLVALWWSPS